MLIFDTSGIEAYVTEKAAYKHMPSHSASTPTIKQLYINEFRNCLLKILSLQGLQLTPRKVALPCYELCSYFVRWKESLLDTS